MAEENAVPKADPEKSRGELNEGRPHPTKDVPAGDVPTENPGLQDDHDPNDLGQKLANTPKAGKSQGEGPAAYAPHDESERAFPGREPAKKKTGEF